MKGGAPSLWCSAFGRAAASVKVREDRVLVHSFPGRPDKVQMFWEHRGLGGHWATLMSHPYISSVCVSSGLATTDSRASKSSWIEGW